MLACTLNPESLHTYYAQDLARSPVWDFWINYRNAQMYCVLNVEALLLLHKLLLYWLELTQVGPIVEITLPLGVFHREQWS